MWLWGLAKQDALKGGGQSHATSRTPMCNIAHKLDFVSPPPPPLYFPELPS